MSTVRFGAPDHYYRATKPLSTRELKRIQKQQAQLYPGSYMHPLRDLKSGDTIKLSTPGGKPDIDRFLRLDPFQGNKLGKMGLTRFEPLKD
jgi:hypothetical protein